MGLSYVIFLNHRALISVFDHFSLWISFFLLVFVAKSQNLTIEWPFECQILFCRDSKMTILLKNRYKNCKNVTFTVPQTWSWAFHKLNGENCLKFDTKGYMGTFLWPLKGQILTHKQSKDFNFSKQLLLNHAKMSLLLSYILSIESFTHKLENITYTRAYVRNFFWFMEDSNISPQRLKRHQF